MSATFKIAAKKIGNNASPDTISSWDSITHLTVVAALEKKFKIKFTDDESVEILNFTSIRKTIISKLK